ncbi:MAG: 4-hydroxy-tetrahydrodipicolinate synthase [Bacillota bacterium]|jgi:4-hydroxy-tetrahydrodipicolinate synthase
MDFGTVITAMVTPFNPDGSINYKKAQELAEYLLNNGSDSLVICGTTGESPTMTDDEKEELFVAVKEVTKGRGALIAGTSFYDTYDSQLMTKRAVKVGVDAILAVSPYYNKPPQEGLYKHFEAIAQSAADLPVILYNIPGRTAVNILPETIARLSKIENIVAVKEAAGDIEQVGKILDLVDDDFLLYSGDDSMTLPMLSLGAAGVISIASHFVGPDIKKMIADFKAGDIKGAMQMHYKLLSIFHKLFIVTNPIPVKYCLNKMGIDVGGYRLPMLEADDQAKKVLDAMLQEYGLI